jgi:hypothetical protein
MRTLIVLVALLAPALALGCGKSSGELNTKDLTDEQKAKIKEDDQRTDADEHGPQTKNLKKR